MKVIFFSLICSLLVFSGCTKEKLADIQENNKTVQYAFKIDSNEVRYMNELTLYMKQPMLEINDTAYIPIKFMLDALDAKNVVYDTNKKEFSFELKQASLNIENLKTYYEHPLSINEISENNKLVKNNQIKKGIENKTIDLQKIINEQKVIAKIINIESSFMYNHAYIVFENRTNLVIKDISFQMLFFDKNGYPVNGDFKSENFDSAIVSKVNIQPKQRSDSNRYWMIPQDAEKIKVCVEKVDFYDDTTWFNDYLNIWLEKERNRY